MSVRQVDQQLEALRHWKKAISEQHSLVLFQLLYIINKILKRLCFIFVDEINLFLFCVYLCRKKYKKKRKKDFTRERRNDIISEHSTREAPERCRKRVKDIEN